MMKLYICNIHDLREGEGLSLLPPERREHILRFRHEADRLRGLGAGLLLRHALGERQNEILKTKYGKPYLAGGPHFNLSHSGDFVILGLSEHTIGVDIERITPYNDKVAKRCYTNEELLWLAGASASGEPASEEPASGAPASGKSADAAFFRLWTAKESIMKATGLGFRMPPESFCVLPITDGSAHTINGATWFLEWSCLPGHMICTASSQKEKRELLRLNRQELFEII